MKGRGLIYLMGPSGSGKDTLLGLLPALLPPQFRVRIAQRCVTRPARDEASCYLPAEAFDHRAARGGFALHWKSHGLAYGIGIEIEDWLALGDRVVVNGSRQYLAQAHARYPGLTAVNITVRAELLAQRLRARGREGEHDIQARLARAQAPFALPARCRYVDIANDAAPAVAAQALARVIISA
ncbi:phosphonate metabolism protein/1,5-bisphosphokinase (PRPP-forming) PhnN [Bordetella hinzii]|uniref:phosphonate metabolism protein/1,5-bisphosphokinase (PRPP-forming) PhnN n=1 Tax=Bordetella hinzii TaxID=103855 RepID=UPI003F1C8760